MIRINTLLLLIICCPSAAAAGTYTEAVEQLEFDLLMHTFADAKVDRLLNGHGNELTVPERQAAAVLIVAGVIDAEDLDNPSRAATRLESYAQVIQSRHPALAGRIGDATLLSRLEVGFDYSELLEADEFLEVLSKQLAKGVITGYDLRLKGVYDGFPTSLTFVYSHSSLLHVRQLVTLLHSEDIDGWVYVTPKVSAFLYREDWGSAGDNVATLPSGLRVVQGREFAVMFRFDSKADRKRFHEVITRYAKRDSKDEQGLIADSWWQPFYYTASELEGFKPISLVVVASDRHEATLTVLEDKTQSVVDALADTPWSARVDKVWVNPPFFRFLSGDYK